MSAPAKETKMQELTEKSTSGSQSWLWAPSPHLQQSSQASLLDIFPLGCDPAGSPRVWVSCPHRNLSAHSRFKHLDSTRLCFLLEGGEEKRGGETSTPIVKYWDINSEATPDERQRRNLCYYNLQGALAPQESRVMTSHPLNSCLLIIYLQTHFLAKIKLGDKWNRYSDPKRLRNMLVKMQLCLKTTAFI